MRTREPCTELPCHLSRVLAGVIFRYLLAVEGPPRFECSQRDYAPDAPRCFVSVVSFRGDKLR